MRSLVWYVPIGAIRGGSPSIAVFYEVFSKRWRIDGEIPVKSPQTMSPEHQPTVPVI